MTGSDPDLWLVVQDDIQQRTVDLDPTVVVYEAKLPKLVHEEADARPCRPDHLSQRLLAYLRDYRLGFAFLAEVGQHQEQPGEALLTRIEQLIDEVRFDP